MSEQKSLLRRWAEKRVDDRMASDVAEAFAPLATLALHEDDDRDGQAQLDLHNAEHDRWQSMTPAQREAAIRWATR